MRRRVDQFNQFGFGELLFLAHDAGAHTLGVDGKGNEDSFAVVASDAFATESHLFD